VSTSAGKKKPPSKASSGARHAAPVKKTAKKKAAPARASHAPVKKAAPAKAPAAKKAAAKPVKKTTAAKPAAKPHAGKAAPAPVAKTAKHAPAPVKSAPAKSAPAAAPKPKPKAVPAPAPIATAKVAAPTPPVVGLPIAFPAGVVPRKPGRGTPKYFVAPVQAPLPPPTSRFADRFAPPRPPTRQMKTEEIDIPREKQKADPKLANAWKTKSGRELTDAEVLAMPDSEYMNEKQIEFFKMKLGALKDDLLSNAGETTEHLREDTSIVPDPADRATIEEEHALELRTRDRERKLLKKISQSLARLESGEYGFCDETGEPIGLGRLIARPTATLSLEAQQRRELKQKMFGD
jgi:DnaK suppressor protein